MKSVVIILSLLITCRVNAQVKLDSLLPIRGFCIAAPQTRDLDSFVQFIEVELALRSVNTLILRIDFNYQYESRPELRDSVALSKQDVKRLVQVCRRNGIRIVPQINMLGHQSWANKTHNLLRVYPELDETPHVMMPAVYKWPNADSLYCKSYCPLLPRVHEILLPMIDEICAVFETNAFHAGMDEVFYIGNEKCPRCRTKDKSELFAGEVTRIRNHLAKSNRELWIWGDRLIDGYTTGIGMWEASQNDTYRAIDLIPKDVLICDWHYERADKTGLYFAMKGFRVVTCPWRNPEIAIKQLDDILAFQKESTEPIRKRLVGVVQTVWSGSVPFLRGYYNRTKDPNSNGNSPWECYRQLYDAISNLH